MKRSRAIKASQTVGVLFVLGALLPFAVIGGWWAMVWMLVTFHLSYLAEATIGIGPNGLFLVVAITLACDFFWALVTHGGCRWIAGFDEEASGSPPVQ